MNRASRRTACLFLLLAAPSSGALAQTGAGPATLAVTATPSAADGQTDTVPPVVISGRRSGDYRVDRIDTPGPLGSAALRDLPFSIGILPSELIENSMARNFKEVSKYLPLVSFQEQQGAQILRPQTRGMQGGNFQNSRLDGMTMYVTVANALEQYEQIEVLSGVSASLYGPANPSGMVNFVSKRPTATPLRRINLGYDSRGIGTAHVDLSGTADEAGVLRYRINALAAAGTGYVDGSHLDRRLGSLAVDLHPNRATVVELTASDYRLNQKGYPGWFTYGQNIVLPTAPDPTRPGYGQDYAGVDMDTQTVTVRLKQDLGSDWHLVAGVLNQDATRDINTPVNNLRNNAGAYTSSLANGFAPRFAITSDTATVNGRVVTGGITHDLAFGTAGYKSLSYAVTKAASAASVLLGSASIANPVAFAPPAAGLPNTRANFNSSTVYQQGFNASDTVGLTETWSVRAAVSQDWFHVANYSAQGGGLPGYADRGASPTAGLIYKPRPDVTTYVTYASSLQAGDVAPGTAANAGAGLAPYRSKQIEAGIKATVGGLDLAAAVFRIERPFANTDTADNVFRISGEQVNRGLELSAVGSMNERLTVFGGITLLDARLRNTPLPATNDKIFVGTPKYKGNVLFEYRVPGVDGLTGTADWQYSGKRPGNDINSFYAAGYNLFDLGARYATRLAGRNVTFRLAVDNVTNKFYWSTIAPSNITGTNTGNLLAHLGAPRTAAASVSVDF